MKHPLPEVWMRGPVEGIPPLLQPVAHALLQVGEELPRHLTGFRDEWLWISPGNKASTGFHLQHMAGVIDRLFTYARNEMLNDQQLARLALEGNKNAALSVEQLIGLFNREVERALVQLRQTDIQELTDIRHIGRKRIPTTLMGLLFHAAEHTMRHNGQLLVTAAWVRSVGSGNTESG